MHRFSSNKLKTENRFLDEGASIDDDGQSRGSKSNYSEVDDQERPGSSSSSVSDHLRHGDIIWFWKIAILNWNVYFMHLCLVNSSFSSLFPQNSSFQGSAGTHVDLDRAQDETDSIAESNPHTNRDEALKLPVSCEKFWNFFFFLNLVFYVLVKPRIATGSKYTELAWVDWW